MDIKTCVFLASFIGLSFSTCKMDTTQEEKLVQFGLLKSNVNVTEDEMKNAVMAYQSDMGLKVTGKIDKKTQTFMDRPSCAIDGALSDWTEWRQEKIFYHLKNAPFYTQNFIMKEIQRACDVWSEFSKIRFVSTKIEEEADVVIDFRNCDGRNNVAAITGEKGRKVLFDTSEWWTRDTYFGTNFFKIALHELGHVLGLNHTRSTESIMFYQQDPTYAPEITLHADDINAIKRLFPEAQSIQAPPIPECPTTNIDAIIRNAKDEYFLLRGNTYWKVDNKKVLMEGPKNATLLWPEVDFPIDAGFSTGNYVFLFKGKFYWKYDNFNTNPKSKLISSGFKNIPDDIDAIIVEEETKSFYFFKGKNYWLYTGGKAAEGYPKKISSYWVGIPDYLDAAINVGQFSYFLKRQSAYKYDKKNRKVAAGYPKNIDTIVKCDLNN